MGGGVGVQTPLKNSRSFWSLCLGSSYSWHPRESLTGAMAQSASSRGRWRTEGRPDGGDTGAQDYVHWVRTSGLHTEGGVNRFRWQEEKALAFPQEREVGKTWTYSRQTFVALEIYEARGHSFPFPLACSGKLRFGFSVLFPLLHPLFFLVGGRGPCRGYTRQSAEGWACVLVLAWPPRTQYWCHIVWLSMPPIPA